MQTPRFQSSIRNLLLTTFGSIQSNAGVNYWFVALTVTAGIVIGGLAIFSPWLAFIGVLGVAFLIIAFTKPIILSYLLVAAATITSGIERGRFIPRFSLNEAALALAVGIAFLIVLITKRITMFRFGYGFIAFLLLGCGGVLIPIMIYLLQGTTLTIDTTFKLFANLQYFLLFWLFSVIPVSDKERKRLLYWMIFCGVIVAVVGLMQAARIGFVLSILERFYPSSHGEAFLDVDVNRVTSLLGAWNATGIFLMTNLLICWVMLNSTSQRKDRIFLIVSMAIVAMGLVGTGSYAGILLALTGIGLSELMEKRWWQNIPKNISRIAVILLVLAMIQPLILPIISNRIAFQSSGDGILPHTLTYRFWVWKEVFLPPIVEHFPLAVSPTIPPNYAWLFEESQYVMLQFRTGLVGLASFVSWILFTDLFLNQLRRNSKGLKFSIISISLVLVFLLTLAGLTNAVFTYAGTGDYLWILLAFSTSPQGAGND